MTEAKQQQQIMTSKANHKEQDNNDGGDDDDVLHNRPNIMEETWLTSGGFNVFDNVELACHHTTTRIPLWNNNFFLGGQRTNNNNNNNNTIKEDDNDRNTQHHQGQSSLLIRSVSKIDMSPLDMLYNNNLGLGGGGSTSNKNKEQQEVLQAEEIEEDDIDIDIDDEFYDGTGHLVWMAAISFAYLLSMGGDDGDDDSSNTTTTNILRPYFDQKRVCELGCGTGVGGITTLVLDLPKYVLFTDNDLPTLELCHKNCQLNNLIRRQGIGRKSKKKRIIIKNNPHCPVVGEEKAVEDDNVDDDSSDDKNDGDETSYKHGRYSLQVFSWGEEIPSSPQVVDQEGTTTITTTSTSNTTEEDIIQIPIVGITANSFDTVLATDAVYDLKMITPLLKSAANILFNRGIFVLSHVPRFCIPRNLTDDNNNVNNNNNNREEEEEEEDLPSKHLEDHIVQQAKLVGFQLLQMIRPHQVLEEEEEKERRGHVVTPPSPKTQSKNNHHHPIIDHTKKPDITTGDEEPLSTVVSIQELRDAHAVVFIFQLQKDHQQQQH